MEYLGWALAVAMFAAVALLIKVIYGSEIIRRELDKRTDKHRVFIKQFEAKGQQEKDYV